MIERLRGEIVEKDIGHVVLLAGGVGYGLDVPLSTYGALPGIGAPADLFVHTHVREESIELFGFATRDERDAFQALQTVSGIGPAMALTILSSLPLSRFSQAIQAGDIDSLVSIKGVGRKTAERLVLELKGKLKGFAWAHPSSGADSSFRSTAPNARNAVSALVNLGRKEIQAERAVAGAVTALGEDASVEDLIREALQRR